MSDIVSGFGPGVFFAMLGRQRQAERFGEGLTAFIGLYYDNYSDATMLDVGVVRAIRELVEESGVGIDVDQLIHDAETAINANGGVEGSEGDKHPVRTPVDIDDEVAA